MTSIELKRLARRIARLEQGQANMSKPQLAYSSIENGNIKSYEGDNLKMSIGLQEDGSSTMRFFDGPVPPVPAGFTALADGPLIQGTWDGTFEDGLQATYDLAYLEVAATLVDDDSRVSFATITAKEGASATLVANQSGQWAVAVRSVSQAGKKSEFASAGTVEVKLVDLAGAIEAVQDSANGKNKVTYSSHAPTPEDPGIFDDTWFVGQVGRPNDVVEATNYVTNSSLEADAWGWSTYSWTGSGARTQGQGAVGEWFYRLTASSALTGLRGRYHDVLATVKSGQKWTLSIHVRPSRTISLRPQGEFRGPSGVVGAPQYGQYFVCPANVWTRIHMTITAVGDATTVRHQTYLHEATLQSGDTLDLDGEMIALGELSPYFDGDTPSGATPNESHYRWTGTPHASTSEKYLPALDIGASDNWNVIEQYRHDGTGWVKVELSHYVFSTVDLGKATVGELDGIRIKAETIAGRSLEADALNFKAARGLLLESPVIRVGNAVEITEDYGIRQFGPDGALNISLPSDGSPASFAGDVRAKSLTATGRMAIEGPAVVASGGQLQLEAGVTPPATPPNVSSYVKRTQFPPLSETENAVGLAFDGTHFWRAVDNSVTGGADRMERIDVNGNLVSSFDHYFWVRNGITVIGSEIFALGIEEGDLRDKSKRFIYVYDFTGTLKRKWEYAAYGSGTYQPAIGTDGTDVFVTQCWAEGHASWRRYNKTTGAGMARYDSVFGLKSDIVAADIGSFDYGSPTMVITKAVERGTVEIYNPTTGEHPNWGGWFAGDIEPVRGTAWANGRFHHLTTAGNLVTMSTTKHPNGSVGPDTNDWWAVYTWKDGASETTISAPRQFTWMRRGGIKLSPGQMPAGVSSVRVYVARKSTEPVSTDYKMVATTVADGSLVVQDLGTPNGTPPVSNSFPNSTPGIIRSTLGGFEVKGDGSGHWGPLVFNADGTMSSTNVPDWVPITSFKSGYGPHSWGYAPAFRVWPDGKVEWRGVIGGDFGETVAGTKTPLIIPAAAMPAQLVQFACASTGGGSNLKRVEFGSVDFPNEMHVYHGDAPAGWVSIDGIYYYKV